MTAPQNTGSSPDEGGYTGPDMSPMFARTPGRDIFGPLDDHLPEVRIPGDVKLDVLRAANEQGLDVSAWVRDLVYGSLYGAEHVASLYQRRMERVLGNAGQKGGA